MQQPVICFFKDNKYIYSTDYHLLSCADSSDTFRFLKQIQAEYADKMKVLKVNYGAFAKKSSAHQALIKTSKIDVFILNNYEFLDERNFPTANLRELPRFSLTTEKEKFIENVKTIQKNIAQGRMYQVNYTAALKAEISENFSALDYFFQTAANTQGNYKAFLPLPNANVMCFSPELFLTKCNDVIKTQPIKGTLLKGEAITNLEQSDKENAELSMIVDLLRNDLNSLSCEKYKDHSRVNFHRKLMQLGYTTHTFSEIEITSSFKLPEILLNTFPGGSISGCPKIESLQQIEEVENYARDFYTGSIGWWQGDDFTLNIAIRSLGQKEQQMFYFTGCGIVYDSDPEKEWQEYLTKCSFLYFEPILDTLKMSKDGFTYLDDHIERTHLTFAHQGVPIEKNQIAQVYQKIQAATEKKDAKIRIVFNRDLSFHSEILPLTNLKQNIKLQLMPQKLAHPKYKTVSRAHWDNYLSVKNPQADDVLIHSFDGKILETSIYSIFYKLNNQFYTPPLNDGCLHGVFRAYHIKKGSITVNDETFLLSERSLNISEISQVELYVGNSVRDLNQASLLF